MADENNALTALIEAGADAQANMYDVELEFADWNAPVKIGYGCGNGTSVGNMGYTDSMPYHQRRHRASIKLLGITLKSTT